jgi:hypothetical protein
MKKTFTILSEVPVDLVFKYAVFMRSRKGSYSFFSELEPVRPDRTRPDEKFIQPDETGFLSV